MSKNTIKNPKSKRQLSERTTGYLLIAPAMLLIFLIAIWPVIQSFYFSLFDLRLNDPSKSQTHMNYSINLERYLNSYPFLVGGLDNEIRNSEINKNKLQDIRNSLQDLNQQLKESPQINERYTTVEERLMNFESITDEMKFVEVDKEFSQNFEQTINDVNQQLRSIGGQLEQENRITGLASAMKDSIVKPNFIGLGHYGRNLSEPRMWKAIYNTFIFTISSVLVELVLGLIIALLINKSFRGRGLVRASILIPWAVPTAVSALMWKFMYDGQNGIIAKYFSDIGLFDRMSDLLTTDTGAMFAVIFSDVWKTTPYMALLLLAGLQTIPTSLYEAASIDGANKWKQFTTITLPLLKSSILVALLFRTLDAFRVFDLIFVLTGGGPANSTETISILAYKVMFAQTNFGEGSALSVIVFLFVALISFIYIKLLGADLISDK